MMQFRMVCAQLGQDGHQLHRFDKVSRHSAEQSVMDANHKAEVSVGNPYAIHKDCVPYSVETREVSEWTEAVE